MIKCDDDHDTYDDAHMVILRNSEYDDDDK
jgi:hypothetical protein